MTLSPQLHAFAPFHATLDGVERVVGVGHAAVAHTYVIVACRECEPLVPQIGFHSSLPLVGMFGVEHLRFHELAVLVIH